MAAFNTDDERLNEMPREVLGCMIEWLTEGNSPEDLAIMILERMSDEEHKDIQANMVDGVEEEG